MFVCSPMLRVHEGSMPDYLWQQSPNLAYWDAMLAVATFFFLCTTLLHQSNALQIATLLASIVEKTFKMDQDWIVIVWNILNIQGFNLWIIMETKCSLKLYPVLQWLCFILYFAGFDGVTERKFPFIFKRMLRQEKLSDKFSINLLSDLKCCHFYDAKA